MDIQRPRPCLRPLQSSPQAVLHHAPRQVDDSRPAPTAVKPKALSIRSNGMHNRWHTGVPYGGQQLVNRRFNEPERRFIDSDRRFDSDRRLDSDRRFDMERRFEAGERRFDPADRRFEPERRFEADRRFETERRFDLERRSDFDRRMEGRLDTERRYEMDSNGRYMCGPDGYGSEEAIYDECRVVDTSGQGKCECGPGTEEDRRDDCCCSQPPASSAKRKSSFARDSSAVYASPRRKSAMMAWSVMRNFFVGKSHSGSSSKKQRQLVRSTPSLT